jgi:hypothetical protein
VVLAEHHKLYKSVSKWLYHPIAERKTLQKVWTEMKTRYE